MLNLDLHDDVLTLTLARPDKRNAMTPPMLVALQDSIMSAPGKGARAIVLAGEGSVFSAGFDLSSALHDDAILPALLHELSALCEAVRASPVPVIAAAHGAALAGACALAASCDMVVTDANAKLGYPVVRLGISPAISGPMLMGAIGAGPARARLLDSGIVDGRRALALGLAHDCVDEPAQVLPRAKELARMLGAKPAHALAATKAWVRACDPQAALALGEQALRASLDLAGNDEQRRMLARALGKAD